MFIISCVCMCALFFAVGIDPNSIDAPVTIAFYALNAAAGTVSLILYIHECYTDNFYRGIASIDMVNKYRICYYI